ncbi:50S ribosomal protein L18 [Candidatus Woesearchaeota archaeon]|nr:50S ribosomal protein L18 [Candidatus Woesearchaeota archaeon]
MAKNAIYTLGFRRKREGKTNYKKRLELLKSNKTRLVIRRSNSAVIVQFINYQPNGDKVIETFHSSKLEKFGWSFSKKSLPACYLAGLVAGVQAEKKGVKEAILDVGLQTLKKGSKIYATLKGVIDAGIIVPSSDEIFPSEERLSGKHIAEYNTKAKTITKTFEDVKKKILS